jgi:hypothetical protein
MKYLKTYEGVNSMELIRAVKDNDIERVKELIKAGAKLDLQDNDERSVQPVMKYLKTYEEKYQFKIGEYVWSTAFNKKYKVIAINDKTLWIENEDGHRAEFLKKDFIPEIDYNISKYNL